jgi:hypothetical protein
VKAEELSSPSSEKQFMVSFSFLSGVDMASILIGAESSVRRLRGVPRRWATAGDLDATESIFACIRRRPEGVRRPGASAPVLSASSSFSSSSLSDTEPRLDHRRSDDDLRALLIFFFFFVFDSGDFAAGLLLLLLLLPDGEKMAVGFGPPIKGTLPAAPWCLRLRCRAARSRRLDLSGVCSSPCTTSWNSRARAREQCCCGLLAVDSTAESSASSGDVGGSSVTAAAADDE